MGQPGSRIMGETGGAGGGDVIVLPWSLRRAWQLTYASAKSGR